MEIRETFLTIRKSRQIISRPNLKHFNGAFALSHDTLMNSAHSVLLFQSHTFELADHEDEDDDVNEEETRRNVGCRHDEEGRWRMTKKISMYVSKNSGVCIPNASYCR